MKEMNPNFLLFVIFAVVYIFLAEPVNVDSCKHVDDNSCVNHKDCCSLYCFKLPDWKTGVCKQPEKNSTPTHLFVESGICSYYEGGGTTASGEPFNEYDVTAAHRMLPFGTMVKIEYGEKESIVVRVNDRGPFINGRILDVSLGAAVQMGMVEKGVVPCRISIVNDYGGINSSYGSNIHNNKNKNDNNKNDKNKNNTNNFNNNTKNNSNTNNFNNNTKNNNTNNCNNNTKNNNNKKHINCKKLLDNTCVIHSDCCSGNCYKKIRWAQGICKPFRK